MRSHIGHTVQSVANSTITVDSGRADKQTKNRQTDIQTTKQKYKQANQRTSRQTGKQSLLTVQNLESLPYTNPIGFFPGSVLIGLALSMFTSTTKPRNVLSGV